VEEEILLFFISSCKGIIKETYCSQDYLRHFVENQSRRFFLLELQGRQQGGHIRVRIWFMRVAFPMNMNELFTFGKGCVRVY
jgi:hypothetical protein